MKLLLFFLISLALLGCGSSFDKDRYQIITCRENKEASSLSFTCTMLDSATGTIYSSLLEPGFRGTFKWIKAVEMPGLLN